MRAQIDSEDMFAVLDKSLWVDIGLITRKKMSNYILLLF